MIFFENCVSLIAQWNKLLLSACKYMDDHQLRIINLCKTLAHNSRSSGECDNVTVNFLYIFWCFESLSKLILACSWMIHWHWAKYIGTKGKFWYNYLNIIHSWLWGWGKKQRNDFIMRSRIYVFVCEILFILFENKLFSKLSFFPPSGIKWMGNTNTLKS